MSAVSTQQGAPVAPPVASEAQVNPPELSIRPTIAVSVPHALMDRLSRAGVQINGPRPGDIRIYDARLMSRIARRGLVGLGEAYVDGWWECDAIDDLYARMLRADIALPEALRWNPMTVLTYLRERLFNLQTRRGAFRNGHDHYDLGNDLFVAFTDPYTQYSCGYWQGGATTLEEAQRAKLELIARKLQIEPGMTVLDIGCGWGGLSQFLAQEKGCRVVGYTVSKEQQLFAQQRCRGLDVEIRLEDYRSANGTYDRVVSVGMFEHVGPKNYRAYFRVVNDRLANDGLALIHFFASQKSFPNLTHSEVHWFSRYIFPGMVIPSLAQVGRAIEGLFVTEDLHNFGADYDPTLMAWAKNFERNWPSLKDKYGDRFYRLWRYYLYGAAGAFRARRYQLWQFVFSKHGVPGGYRSVR